MIEMLSPRCVLTIGSTFRTLASIGEYCDIFLEAIVWYGQATIVQGFYTQAVRHKVVDGRAQDRREKYSLCLKMSVISRHVTR